MKKSSACIFFFQAVNIFELIANQLVNDQKIITRRYLWSG